MTESKQAVAELHIMARRAFHLYMLGYIDLLPLAIIVGGPPTEVHEYLIAVYGRAYDLRRGEYYREDYRRAREMALQSGHDERWVLMEAASRGQEHNREDQHV